MKIILISLDTLRANHLGSYGYPLQTSPYLDDIAKQGVLFENAFASDIPTEVAHTSLFTGKVGLSTGVVSHGSTHSYLPKSVEWLPDLLRRKGLVTAAVDNLYHLKEWFARGYRYYINTKGEKRWIDGQTINAYAKPWLTAHKEDDFFLFLHYWDPHTPYLPPKNYIPEFYLKKIDPYDANNKSMDEALHHRAYPFFKQHHYDLLGGITDKDYMNALYDAEIRYLDDLLKDLDDHLDTLGIKEETLLILFGDHGESLTEHDIYWDHCGLYDTTVHVPLLMRWPEEIAPGKRVKALVQHADLMPTILEAVGEANIEGLDGKSLWPVVEGKTQQLHSEIYLSECAWQASRGLRTPNYKYIRTLDSGPFVRPYHELYDLREDPSEEHNLAEVLPEVTQDFEKQLEHWVEKKIKGREDPMLKVLKEEGLPFKRRIEQILKQYNLTWQDWSENPDPARLDEKGVATKVKPR
ncbi:arylsulfatase A-like enzyme [Pullulanibacillus pueri]|uniref:Sulfatase n=1 Tax=Pullulanibacillus pueri TaxID=1437324 RepID=A0A8J3ELD3_9BACL|nr:sulfatase [Pullulanibacillus pueri]MBM7680272.1 arylsulfatase A-like enzyme [Pullulanibacillus pueri]GGH75913.1 sulfatase [Pullulanibacillus pueri]